MEELKIESKGKIKWGLYPKEVLMRFSCFGTSECEGKKITVKIKFKDGLAHGPSFLPSNDRAVRITGVESYEVIEGESSDGYQDYIIAWTEVYTLEHESILHIITQDYFYYLNMSLPIPINE